MMRFIFCLLILLTCKLAFSQPLSPYFSGQPFGWYKMNWVWLQKYPDLKMGYRIGKDATVPVFDEDGFFCDTCRQNVLAQGIRFRPYSITDKSRFCQPELPNMRFNLNGYLEQDCDHRFDTIYDFIGKMTYYPPDARTCNSHFVEARQTHITYLSDSLLSVEIKTSAYLLPENERIQMQLYNSALQSFGQRAREIAQLKNNKKRNRKMMALYSDTIICPKLLGEISVEPFFRETFKYGDKITDNYQWIFLRDTLLLHQAKLNEKPKRLDSVTYRALVFNPYHPWKEVKLDVLFGPEIYQIIENEMSSLALSKTQIPFNEHHYKAVYERHFMWGLAPDALIIYYGNEGEFGAFAKHKIPFSRLWK